MVIKRELMKSKRINVVFLDENKQTRSALVSQFKESYCIYAIDNPQDLFQLIKHEYIHVVLCAQRIQGTSGVDVLRQCRKMSPHTTRLLLTGYADLAMIVGTIEEGEIYRYITKPWHPEDLEYSLYQASILALQTEQNKKLTPQLPHTEQLLLIDDCSETHELIYSQFSNNYQVVWADNIDKAIHLLKTQDFGVIVSDMRLNGVNIANLLISLKTKLPLSLILLLTRFQEATMLNDLINDGHIYRCLPKPVRASLLELSLHRAFSEHRRLQTELSQQMTSPIRDLADSSERVKCYIEHLQANTLRSI